MSGAVIIAIIALALIGISLIVYFFLLKPKSAGEDCLKNEDCGDNMKCFAFKCGVNPNKLGEECNSDSDCFDIHQCDDQICSRKPTSIPASTPTPTSTSTPKTEGGVTEDNCVNGTLNSDNVCVCDSNHVGKNCRVYNKLGSEPLNSSEYVKDGQNYYVSKEGGCPCDKGHCTLFDQEHPSNGYFIRNSIDRDEIGFDNTPKTELCLWNEINGEFIRDNNELQMIDGSYTYFPTLDKCKKFMSDLGCKE